MTEKPTKKSPIKLSTDLLVDLGFEKLTADQASLLLKELYTTLEVAVGATLLSKMNEEQIDDFTEFIDAGDEPGALRWLERNFKEYPEDVWAALKKLERDLQGVSGISEPKTTSNEAFAGGR